MKLRRHKCPPGIILEIKINDHTVIGPIDSESLAYIAKFTGENGILDLMQGNSIDQINTMEILVSKKNGA